MPDETNGTVASVLSTMSTKPENIRANYDMMDFMLSSVDMSRIDAMSRIGHRIVKSG